MAGGGAGEVLEEGGESTQPRYLSRLEGLQNRIWQAGLVHPLIVQTTSKSTQSSANDLCLCKHISLNLNKFVKCEMSNIDKILLFCVVTIWSRALTSSGLLA